MSAVHENETDREIELERCPETNLTNVTLIKSHSLLSKISLLERHTPEHYAQSDIYI